MITQNEFTDITTTTSKNVQGQERRICILIVRVPVASKAIQTNSLWFVHDQGQKH